MSRKKFPKTTLIVGTRPEIIKLSPILRLLCQFRRPFTLIHMGQHYSYDMDRVFFNELGLPEPNHQLEIRSNGVTAHANHVGRMMHALEKVLLAEKPDVVLVQGDTNTVLAGSLVVCKLPGVLLGHVEAGLRSYDWKMPEEINRIVSDHVSDYLFTPTSLSRRILLGEGVSRGKIFVTGNTIVDAVEQNLEIAKKKVSLKKLLPDKTNRFFLMTLHRQENVDERKRLLSILSGIGQIIDQFKTKVVFPVHPRTWARIRRFGVLLPSGLQLIKPVGFLSFLRLEQAADMILTDSGGVQEEACILKVPCVTIRTTTERPETTKAGANIVAGYSPERMLKAALRMHKKTRNWENPFGDGHASERIIRILERDR